MRNRLKTALVTGAAKRIGKAIVEDLAEAGFAVAIHCHGSRAKADELAAGIERQGGRAVVVEGDLTDMEAATGLFTQATAALGPIGLLVNNASIFADDAATDFSWENWERHFSIHLKTPVMLTRLFAQRLPEDAEGLVVNMIDQRVWKLSPRFFTYTLSKSALWTATQTMAQALGPRIRVNAIGPGPTLQGERQQKADFDRQVRNVILGRKAELAEFGATIRYLWEAGSVTGQMIALDGGQHLAWQTPDVTGIRE